MVSMALDPTFVDYQKVCTFQRALVSSGANIPEGTPISETMRLWKADDTNYIVGARDSVPLAGKFQRPMRNISRSLT